jgi:hypothetical protein
MKTIGGIVLLGVMVGAAPAHAFYDYSYTPTAEYQWAPLRLSTVSGCDDCGEVVNLPWAFPFYGRTFTQVTVSSNGYLVMGNNPGGAGLFGNVELNFEGVPGAPGPVIAPMWDDWNPAAGGDVFVGMVGSAFVIEWFALYHFGQSNGTTTSFEVKLFADGTIEFHYSTTGDASQAWHNGISATIGFQEDVDTVGEPLSFNSWFWSSYGRKFRFIHPGRVALYARARHTYAGAPQPRTGQHFALTWGCSVSPTAYQYGTIETPASSESKGGFARASVNPACTGAADFNPPLWTRHSDEFSVATILGTEPNLVRRGNYYYYKHDGFTPKPAQIQYWDIEGRWSRLEYWQGGSAIDKPIVVVPGIDVLDEDGASRYLAMMHEVARPLLAEGYDFAIGDWARGDDNLFDLSEEASIWIEDAYWRDAAWPWGVQPVGVSMGGIVLRDALDDNLRGALDMSTAWYSIDAPQEGANLGRPDHGIQPLIMCHGDPAQQRMLQSAPAKFMLYNWVGAWTCDTWGQAENAIGYGSTSWHDNYYAWVNPPPTTVPRYAVAFSDAAARPRNGSGTLFDFEYTGWLCTEDTDWDGSPRDCAAGSYFLTGDNGVTGIGFEVNRSSPYPGCGNLVLNLRWNPTFIPADSALMADTGNQLSASGSDGACNSTYGSFSAPYWTAFWSNDNGQANPHAIFPSGAVSTVLGWVRANGG